MKIVEYNFVPAKKQRIKGSDKQVLAMLKKLGYHIEKKFRDGDIQVCKPCQLKVRVVLTEDGPDVWYDLYNEIKRVYGEGDEKLYKKHFNKFLAEYDKEIKKIDFSEDGKDIVILFNKTNNRGKKKK